MQLPLSICDCYKVAWGSSQAANIPLRKTSGNHSQTEGLVSRKMMVENCKNQILNLRDE